MGASSSSQRPRQNRSPQPAGQYPGGMAQQQRPGQAGPQQQRPGGGANYPANMRQPLNPNLFPTAAPAPIQPQFAFNSVGPRNNLKEGEKLTQVATVDRKSITYDVEGCLLSFAIASTGPCSYEVHSGIRECIDKGKVLYTPNRMKKAPIAYLIDKALPDGETMLALLDEEIPQMNPAELVYNAKYPKFFPCVIVLRWKDENGDEFGEHTFLNLGLKPAEGQTQKTGAEAPGFVHKQLLEAKGSVYLIEPLFGVEDDIVVGAVAGEEGKEGAEGIAEGNIKPASPDDDDDNGLCVICISEPKDTCVIPCRHLCLCKDCAQELQKHSPKCPVCREPIQQLLHLKG